MAKRLRLVLDACVIIEYLNGDVQEDSLNIKELVETCDCFVHCLQALEVICHGARMQGKDGANAVLKQLNNMPITISRSMSNGLLKQATELKRVSGVPIIDSICAAYANSILAQVITMDSVDFPKLGP